GEVFVRARQAAGGIAVERLTVRAGEPLAIEGTARLPYRWADGKLVRVDGVAAQLALDVKVSDVDHYFGIPGKFAELAIRGSADELRVTARCEDLAPVRTVVLTGDTWVELTANRTGVVAAVRSEKNPVGDLVGELRTNRGLDWTREKDWRDLADGGTVDGRLTLAVPDLSMLREFAPNDILALAGSTRVDLRVTGPVRDPAVTGKADVAALACKLAGDFPALRDGSGRVRFEGRALHFEEFTATMGYGPVGMAGSVSWAGGAPRVDLTIVGENALLARNPYLRLRADMDVAVLGPVDALTATGKVRITDGLYTKPMRLVASGPRGGDAKLQLFSIRDGPLSRMRFDIAVTTKEERSFRVRNNAVRGAFQLDLLLGGTGAVPEPTGTIQFRDTLAKLPFSSLKVDLGEVKFTPENPFAPRVELQAHTRMKGYDLEVSVRGAMPDLEVYVSSRPALPQEDAVLLLTTGVTRRELEDDGIGKTAMTKVASLVGRRLVADLSGPSDPDRRSFFDRFEFVIGRNVSRTGADTIEGEFEITERFYLRGERDRFDAYNMGVVWRLRFR
ncbi:MAG: translocation/assembly module TamB, partial [Planctomycetota bacterium]|nr:translocation/assembly module TamB [Planctomycetota bacterium]